MRPAGARLLELDLMPEQEQEALADIDDGVLAGQRGGRPPARVRMRWFAGQEKPPQPHGRCGLHRLADVPGVRQLAHRALCKSAGFTSVDTQKVQRYFTFMTDSWSTRRVGEHSALEVRHLRQITRPSSSPSRWRAAAPRSASSIEAQNNPTTLQTSWEDGLALNERLNKEFGVPLEHFDRVKDLFEPHNPEASFSLWHAFCLKPDGRAEMKVYLNPQARGPEHANALVEEALPGWASPTPGASSPRS